ncbi:MAG: hypothetical protein QM756_08045 [Polyangiaceae bacterium]
MQPWRLLLLLVPLAGIAELVFDLVFATRAPLLSEWVELQPHVQAARDHGQLVVVAPAWAEPLARQAFGDELFPLEDVGRADVSAYPAAIEVSLFGERAAELSAFKEESSDVFGKFTLRTLKNPAPEPVLYAFTDHVRPNDLFVVEWNGEAERSCDFTRNAPSSAGGLGGHNAYPRERFRCSGGEPFFAGVTVMDDQNYRPRRCLYAHPPLNANLHLRFPRVPVGKRIRGYVGESFLIARDAVDASVELGVFVDGREIGHREIKIWEGFTAFDFPLPTMAALTMEVTFQVGSKAARDREFCIQAEVR